MKGDNRYTALGVDPDKVFLLDPTNQAFLLGHKLKPSFIPYTAAETTFRNRVMGWFVVAFFLVGIPIIFAVQLFPSIVAQYGVPAQATVTNIYTSQKKSGIEYRVQYVFSVEGHSYQADESIGDFPAYHTGSIMVIKYMPFAPNRPVIVASYQVPFAGVNASLIIGGTVAILVYGFIVFIAYTATKISREEQRLLDDWPSSQLIVGEIVSCSGEKITLGNKTENSYFMLTVEYALCPPGTDKVERYRQTKMRNDLLNKPLPQAGTPVVVLFFKDRYLYDRETRHDIIL